MGVTRLKKATEATITSTGRGPGTYPYMAPEMFRKSRRGKPADIYYLGCTLLELFGQSRVWLGLDASEIMMRVCGSFETPPSMPDMSHLTPERHKICIECCQLDAASRPTIETIVELLKIMSLKSLTHHADYMHVYNIGIFELDISFFQTEVT